MTKTIHWLTIVAITTILIGSVSVGFVAFADDGPAKTFGFHSSSTSGGPPGDIVDMTGGGFWIIGTDEIEAEGGFTTTTGLTGTWEAEFLYTGSNPLTSCPPCTNPGGVVSSSGTAAVFEAEFETAGGAEFTADVIVALPGVDINGVSGPGSAGTPNFWVGGFGFGPTDSGFL